MVTNRDRFNICLLRLANAICGDGQRFVSRKLERLGADFIPDGFVNALWIATEMNVTTRRTYADLG